MIWRIAGYLPNWRGFNEKGVNWFDLFLAVITTIIQIPPIHNWQYYPWLTASQLARFYRVILAVPTMRPLLVGEPLTLSRSKGNTDRHHSVASSLRQHERVVEHDVILDDREPPWSIDRGSAFPRRRSGRQPHEFRRNLYRILGHVSGTMSAMFLILVLAYRSHRCSHRRIGPTSCT